MPEELTPIAAIMERYLKKLPTYPVEMKGLMDGSHDLSEHFKNNIRSYNSALSFASMGAQIVPPAGRGAYCFRIHGQIYHRTSHLHPVQAGEEKFAQLYVLDSELATCRRMERLENSECNPELLQSTDEVIRLINPFSAAYQMTWELEQQVLREGHEDSENFTMYISDERLDSDQHRGRYNVPKTNEAAMVFKSSDGIPPNKRDICIYPKQCQLQEVDRCTLPPNAFQNIFSFVCVCFAEHNIIL
ncbi:helitron_like_N domain-containing protein [Trichonephila inaurata madagascariensis]|uniref:Helitron_like_N domain-containing protein n=1 Tax=Trichonephila inaurata madagascariensis TaxID=2747483 RepID=A0A8X6WUC1_9ARAC|nr:helitron_like_N domain-containing protein [Trichonephila inaurata madagascariensis]